MSRKSFQALVCENSRAGLTWYFNSLPKDCSHLTNVCADTEQWVQQRRLVQRGRLIGQAPEEQAQHDVAPQLAGHVKQGEHPVADHADAAREPAGQPRRQIIRKQMEVQRLQRAARWQAFSVHSRQVGQTIPSGMYATVC